MYNMINNKDYDAYADANSDEDADIDSDVNADIDADKTATGLQLRATGLERGTLSVL